MNKGGRGKETREKFCYACSKPKSKLEFSSSQWDVKEDLKSRRCSACIDGRCQVGALLPGQLKLTFGTPANTAANSTPPQPPPALLPSPPISSSVSTVVAPNPSSASTVVAPNPSSVSTVVAAAPTRTFADIVEKEADSRCRGLQHDVPRRRADRQRRHPRHLCSRTHSCDG